MIDVDGSGTISKEETKGFWKSNFGGVNTKALFDQVDKNDDGTIQVDEWMDFWTNVFMSGYQESELCKELDNLMEGKAWVKFKTKDGKYTKKEKNYKNE
jgi:hypothetical protein